MALDQNLLSKIARREWNLRSIQYPDDLRKVPTMLTREECRMLTWLAQTVPSGNGAVIDLGSFLGGSTAHLAYGLSLSAPNRHVDAYDQFTIADEHKQAFLYDWGQPELQGNDMLHLFEEFVRPFGKAVPHHGQFEKMPWTGGPIELLFVDICKGWESMRHVMHEFYPSLVPEKSIVIHQDYQHWMHPWVVATTEALAPYLRLVSYTEDNSAIFVCRRQIDTGAVQRAIASTASYLDARQHIVRAAERFQFARQREAVWQQVIALDRNPNAQYSWDLSLG